MTPRRVIAADGPHALGAEVVVDAGNLLGEGPIWDERGGRLWWVDIDGRRVHSLDPVGARATTLRVDRLVSAIVARAGGGHLLVLRRGIGAFDSAGAGVRELIRLPERRPCNRLNDCACDSLGRLWVGSMALDGTHGAGTLYRIEPDWRITPVLTGVTISNGIGWSPDERLMYYVDTGRRAVERFCFDVATGSLRRAGRLVTIAPALGKPDGLAVDADGCVWVALWGGGAVHRYTPRGDLDRRIALPVSQVTSCCFGGADLDELYITTAARGLDGPTRAVHARESHAGALFACRPGAQGQPTRRFAGRVG